MMNRLIEEQHAHMVRMLAKEGQQIIADLTMDTAHLLHMAVGISGEAGEVLDRVKKLAIYNQPMDLVARKNLVEELGDLEFYMQGLRDVCGITREETILENLEKLGMRYASGKYSDQQAKDRADKKEMFNELKAEDRAS